MAIRVSEDAGFIEVVAFYAFYLDLDVGFASLRD